MKKIHLILGLILLSLNSFSQGERWSEQRVNDWYKQYKWLCGMNYIPANAINYTAMWDKTSFSPDVLDKELKLANSIGMNCARVVLQYAVYEDDPQYFLNTFDRFLEICDKYGVKAMPCFFDDCTFGVNTNPSIGVQPEPLEGWYAWAWSPSPGYTMVVDEREHPKLEKYVKDILLRFSNDKRILLWDLYNEPTNTSMPERSLPLVEKVFDWAREINPQQPLSIGAWNGNKELEDIILAQSDVITFHCYDTAQKTEEQIKRFLSYNRPVICTEWMNRVAKSEIVDILPIMKKYNVGSMIWGLVNGKTQTHLGWGHRPEKLPFKGPWQHDIYHTDFTPYDSKEIDLIDKLTK